MTSRNYDALLLDLDGTLVGDDGHIHRDTLTALRAAERRGVRVMVATGRSENGALPTLMELGSETPAIVFNGAALCCPRTGTLFESRVLEDAIVDGVLALAEREQLIAVTMAAGEKRAVLPESAAGRAILDVYKGTVIVPPEDLSQKNTVRISVFSDGFDSSDDLAELVGTAVDENHYVTHFPIRLLPKYRDSDFLVCDVQPPCKGKAEAFRVLQDRYAIPPERVVAVGDSQNDQLMLDGAGLAVVMANGAAALRARADRVIGDCNSDAIAQLVRELFLA